MVATAQVFGSPSVSSAERLLAEKGLDGIWPIPLEKLAKAIGYDTLFFDPVASSNPNLVDVSGAVDHVARKIYINDSESLGRKRFTLAHEIAHACLHAGDGHVIDYRKNILTPTDKKEVEANRFAADLLMPALMFAKMYFGFYGSVPNLAKYFTVSEDAARVRIKQLGLERV